MLGRTPTTGSAEAESAANTGSCSTQTGTENFPQHTELEYFPVPIDPELSLSTRHTLKDNDSNGGGSFSISNVGSTGNLIKLMRVPVQLGSFKTLRLY